MVAAVVEGGQPALAVDGPAELAAPDDQGLVEQAALLEVPDQRRRGLIGITALAGDLGGQVGVLVPAAMEELDEPHAALGQPARQQAVRGIRPGPSHVGAVHLQDRCVRLADRSVNSGTEVCMRNASSYWLIRVRISGSPNSS